MRWFYTLLFYCCLPLIITRLLWRSRKAPAYRQRLSERFGFSSRHTTKHSLPSIWLHTVSVGETIAAYPVAQHLLETYPQYVLWVTTTTPTGSARAQDLFSEEITQGRVIHSYMPYDLPDCLARFIKQARPVCAIFMETEVWPNTLAMCNKKNIPCVLINARLSEKSLLKYQRVISFSQKTFSQFTHVVAQTLQDAERLGKLGAASVTVSGNIKSEVSVSPALVEKASLLRKQWSCEGKKTVVIAASTHVSEDEIMLSAYRELHAEYPSSRLVIVPRHPERFSSVKQLCIEQGWQVACRSEGDSITESTQIIIGDTLGELLLFYGASDIAIMGGSFIEHGGHNMLEAAVWGLPIISGPSVYNFAQIAEEMQSQNALVLVNNQQALTATLHQLINDTSKSTSLGCNAKQYVEQSTGAVEITAAVIQTILMK
jgi:3-deoxy-D-manno-octulosonic-acid transferase